MPVPLLDLRDVHARYGQSRVLHGISLAVEPGEVVALLGANGAGKTTTLRTVSGTVTRTGTIEFEGRSLNSVSPEDIARRGIAHVPEGRGAMAQLSVADNLRLGAHVRGDRSRLGADYDRVFELFPILKQRRSQAAGTLSGGEQQMLAIGRALMSRPQLMLLDEPSLGLAPKVVRLIFDIVRSINREEGVSVLLVEQNATLALEIANQAFVLEVGRIAAGGAAADLSRDESVRRSYLGY